MELKGLADFRIALLDDTGKIIADADKGLSADGIFTVDLSSSKGATTATINNIAPTATAAYGSDALAEQFVGNIKPTVALAANSIPHEIMDKLSGLSKEDGGYARRGAPKPTYVAVLVHSHNADATIDAYIGFAMGILTPGELAIATDQDNPTVIHDALSFTGQTRPSDKLIYKRYYSDDTDFKEASMLTEIFEGYTAIPKA